jgi:hypothetical protein
MMIADWFYTTPTIGASAVSPVSLQEVTIFDMHDILGHEAYLREQEHPDRDHQRLHPPLRQLHALLRPPQETILH